MDSRTGGRAEGGDWCCEACTVVHQQEISETIMDALMKGEALAVAWKKLEGML
jgi:Zn-finger protein